MPWLKDMFRQELEGAISRGVNHGMNYVTGAVTEGVRSLSGSGEEESDLPWKTKSAATDPNATFTFDLTSYDAVVDFMAFHMESDAHSNYAKQFQAMNKSFRKKNDALFNFAQIVTGIWDYKGPLYRSGLLMQARQKSSREFPCTPVPGDNEFLYYYDIWGNMHYGFVGRYCGFTEEELLTGSRINDAKNFLELSSSNDDATSVEAGFRLYEMGSADAVTIGAVISEFKDRWTENVTKFHPSDLTF